MTECLPVMREALGSIPSISKTRYGRVSVIPAFGRCGQEKHKFKAILGYKETLSKKQSKTVKIQTTPSPAQTNMASMMAQRVQELVTKPELTLELNL